MITGIEDFFTLGCGRCERFATPDCSTRQWSEGLLALRQLCLGVGLVETLKWAHPCYTHQGRNIALMGALRGDFRLSFFNAALLTDPAGVLERAGPNSQQPDLMRFSSAAQVAAMAPTIRAYLQEAMGHAEAGTRPHKVVAELVLPAELTAALGTDPELAAAFARLTPGRQRSYVINLNAAKKSETRVARLAAFRGHILAGKGAQER